MFSPFRRQKPQSFGQYRRCFYVTSAPLIDVPKLFTSDTETFRLTAFCPEVPCSFPRGHFANLPAIAKWFITSPGLAAKDGAATARHADEGQQQDLCLLNTQYLQTYADDMHTVPVELTPSSDSAAKSTTDTFERASWPLTVFLAHIDRQQCSSLGRNKYEKRVYVAQCALSDLPPELCSDLPTPELILKAGRGDVYASNLWLGQAPTYTPLHKDPNPNLFVQLAGRKIVRLAEPALGSEMFREVSKRLNRSSWQAIRGEEMMQGEEKRLLDAMVWGKEMPRVDGDVKQYEAALQAGDGLFIPKGWWHSIKGTGRHINASVNWWFR